MPTRSRQSDVRSAHQQLQRLLQRPFDLWPPGEPFTPWTDGLEPSATPFEPLADIEEAVPKLNPDTPRHIPVA